MLFLNQVKSIRLKIVLMVGALFFLSLALLITYAAISMRTAAIRSTEQQIVALAEGQAAAIDAEIEVALDVARTLAQSFSINPSSMPASLTPPLTRDTANAMLFQVLRDNPDFLGTYTLWEPNAFDGLDAQYVGAPAHDQTGRFIPYWVRDELGNIHVEAIIEYETEGIGDWYLIPRRTRQEVIIDPYLYPIGDTEVLMTSLVAPVVVNGQFYGVAGVDFRVGFMQTLASQLDIYDKTGRMVLISNKGIVAGATGHPDWVGQDISAISPDLAAKLPLIQSGQQSVGYLGQELEVYVPVWPGKATTPWSVRITVPTAQITADATAQMWRMLGIGAFLMVVSLGLLWLAATQIARPIQEITAVAQTVRDGNLQVEARVQTQDEVGILAGVFNQMTRQLRDMVATLEQRVAERTQDLLAAAEVSSTVTSALTPLGLEHQVVDLVRERFALYYVGLFLVDEAGEQIELRAGTGEPGRTMVERGHKFQVGDKGSMIGRCVSGGQAEIALDVGKEAQRFANPLLPLTRSEMALPLRVRGRAIGAMTVQSEKQAAFDESDIVVMQTMADQVAGAIDNARLLVASQSALSQMQEVQRRYLVRAWEDYASAHENSYESVRRGSAAVKSTASRQDIQQAVAAQQVVSLHAQGRSTLAVPVLFRGQAIGALSVDDERVERQWTDQEIALVQAVADRMSQLSESLRLLDDTQRREARERLAGEVAGRIRQELDLETVLKTTVDQIQQALGLEKATIRLVAGHGENEG